MIAFRPFILLAAALAGAAPVQTHAQPAQTQGQASAQAQPEADVVVTGTREREREIAAFVRALTPGSPGSQLARFEHSICPVAHGLLGPAKAAVEARMRQVAVAVGLQLGEANCRPNVLLMITRDKRAMIGALASRYPHFFGDEPENDPRRVARQPGNASAWYSTVLLSAEGRVLNEGGGYLAGRSRNASRITESARPVFYAAAVVIESDALPGLSLTQLADYAMMRALARTQPERVSSGGAARTVLSVLDAAPDAEVPLGLTRWDIGFLRGLYAGTNNLRTPQQRGEIQQRVGTELDRAARN